MDRFPSESFVIVIFLFFFACGLLISCERKTNHENEIKVDFSVEQTGNITAVPASTPFGISDKCVIGLILVGPRDDNGWSEVHFEAAVRVTEELGCELITFESLNVGDSPETTVLDVATMMVDRGADMIILSADTFEDDAAIVAEKFPKIAVLQISGSNRLRGNSPKNLANSHSMQEASRFIAGCVAVRKAYSIINEGEQISIGYLGPLINAETRRQASSAYIGARYGAEKLGLNPDTQLKFVVVWIGFWFNIPGVTLDPTEVSHDFFDRGTQVIISGIDTTEPIRVASSRREQGADVWAVGAHINACSVAENACIGAQFYDWTITYRYHIKALLKGEWIARWELRTPNWEQFTNTEPGATSVGFTINHLTEEEQLFIFQAITELASDSKDNPGMFPGWRGPLNLQNGKPLALEGDIVNPFDVWFLPQLVEGIVGTSASQ